MDSRGTAFKKTFQSIFTLLTLQKIDLENMSEIHTHIMILIIMASTDKFIIFT